MIGVVGQIRGACTAVQVSGGGQACVGDVTGLASEDYTLRVMANPSRTLTESNYENNVLVVGVTL